ncbi:hypothetical protein HRH59_15560 [Rheinheimera sp. YQF-2]|uniref:Uncharacterized protein n=2 Tax=Rheinheimera lutimaris TaxID=2740584 RepID=A0A7Y5ASX1_9GAMM|nr:hypothetical protein [Rheinheimera lutimaris]
MGNSAIKSPGICLIKKNENKKVSENTCTNCHTPLPISFTSKELACSLCGQVNYVHLEKEQPLQEDQPSEKAIAKKSPIKKVLNGLFLVVLIVYLLFLGAERLGLVKYTRYTFFYSPQKVELTHREVKNMSRDNLVKLLGIFNKQVIRPRWIESVASRSKLSAWEVQQCSKINIDLNEEKNVWVVEFYCEVDYSKFSDGNAVSKEMKNEFESFLKKIKLPIN